MVGALGGERSLTDQLARGVGNFSFAVVKRGRESEGVAFPVGRVSERELFPGWQVLAQAIQLISAWRVLFLASIFEGGVI